MGRKDLGTDRFDGIPSTHYNTAGIRDLIKDAFTAKEFARVCQDSPDFHLAHADFGNNASLEDMIDVIIEHSRTRALFPNLLSEIERYNPTQFERHRIHLFRDLSQEQENAREAQFLSQSASPEEESETEPMTQGAFSESAGEAQSKPRSIPREQLPENYAEILDTIARAIEADRCVLFLGPACSETIELRQELGLTPLEALTQKTLICKLAEELEDEGIQSRIDHVCGECPDCSRCILPDVAAHYEEAHNRSKLRSFISDLLGTGKPRGFHHQLWNLPFAAIYTINYDELIIEARKGAVGVVTEDRVFATVSLPVDYDGIPFYKLHGSMDAEDVVITVDDQHKLRLARQQSPLWKRLRWDLRSKVFLFVGYALGDMDVVEVIYSVYEETGGQRPHQSYAVIETPMPWNAEREMRKYRIETVRRNTDQFFEDLTKRYLYWLGQWSQISSTTPLAIRQPTVWDAFRQLLEDPNSNGLSLYGRGTSQSQKLIDPVKGELRVIPTEMYDECKRRQAQGERVLCVSLDFGQLGINVSVDSWRSLRLLDDLVRQLDNERSVVGLPSLDLLDELKTNSEPMWTKEADDRVHTHWERLYNEYSGKERTDKVASAKSNPTQEQQEINRRKCESFLTGQISDWLNWELDSALAGYRLIVLITDFHLIEPDDEWFDLVNQHFLNVLCSYNVGVIITRWAAKKFLVSRKFASYGLNQFNQIDLGKLYRGEGDS